MLKSSLIFLLFLISLIGCTSNINYNSLHNGEENNFDDDVSIGFRALSTLQNNKKFEIWFSLAEQNIDNCKNILILDVNYEGFQPEISKTPIILALDVLSKDDKSMRLEFKSIPFSDKELKEIKNEYGGAVTFVISFTITKDDYKRLSNSKSIKYHLTMPPVALNGDFPEESILELQKYSKKLLSPICRKGQTFEEAKKEIKQGLNDFVVLKAGALKADLEKHFHTKFENKKKNTETGLYEEVIKTKVFDKELGPLIIGFNEKDELVYVRDVFNKSKIKYLKNQK